MAALPIIDPLRKSARFLPLQEPMRKPWNHYARCNVFQPHLAPDMEGGVDGDRQGRIGVKSKSPLSG